MDSRAGKRSSACISSERRPLSTVLWLLTRTGIGCVASFANSDVTCSAALSSGVGKSLFGLDAFGIFLTTHRHIKRVGSATRNIRKVGLLTSPRR